MHGNANEATIWLEAVKAVWRTSWRPFSCHVTSCSKRLVTASAAVNDAAACYWLQPLRDSELRLVSARSPWRCLRWWARPSLGWNHESSLIYMLNNGKLICKLFLSDCHHHPSSRTSLLMSLWAAAACRWSGIIRVLAVYFQREIQTGQRSLTS